MICPICSTTMINGVGGYQECLQCGYMSSSLTAGAGAEIEGISSVRNKNFEKIIDELEEIVSVREKTLLDVGCSSGDFMQVASHHGFKVFGIEPEGAKIFSVKKIMVWDGFFPHDLPRETKFDVMVFNDSIEHMPDLKQVTDGIKQHLSCDGILIVNLPTNDGLLFLIARLLARFGMTGSLNRLWQKKFSSPHVHYFNKRCLEWLFEENGFTVLKSFSLATYTFKGLWKRIVCGKESNMKSLISYFFLLCIHPFSVLKSDIACVIFKRNECV